MKLNQILEAWEQMPEKYVPQEGERVKVNGKMGTVVDPDPAPSGLYVTVKVGGKRGYYHKSDVMIKQDK